jgi:hypothetical protein
MPLIAAERSLLGRLRPALGGDEHLQRADLAEEIVSALEARALWARYGL